MPAVTPSLGKPVVDRKQLAKQRLEKAQAEFVKWQKMKNHEDEMRSQAHRMRITPPQPDPALAMRFNGAWTAYEQARKAYEELEGKQ